MNKKIEIPLKLDEFRLEIQRRDQEIMSMAAKMKTLEEQHQVIHDPKAPQLVLIANLFNVSLSFTRLKDYQRHISVLKESLCAKEEHYNMLQADVRQTLKLGSCSSRFNDFHASFAATQG